MARQRARVPPVRGTGRGHPLWQPRSRKGLNAIGEGFGIGQASENVAFLTEVRIPGTLRQARAWSVMENMAVFAVDIRGVKCRAVRRIQRGGRAAQGRDHHETTEQGQGQPLHCFAPSFFTALIVTLFIFFLSFSSFFSLSCGGHRSCRGRRPPPGNCWVTIRKAA